MRIENHQVCKIAPGVRLQFEKVQDSWVLLYPEGMVTLGETASDILRELDRDLDVAGVIAALKVQYGEVEGLADDVHEFLTGMVAQGWVKAYEREK